MLKNTKIWKNNEETYKVHSVIADSVPTAHRSYGYKKNVLNLYISEIQRVFLAFERHHLRGDL